MSRLRASGPRGVKLKGGMKRKLIIILVLLTGLYVALEFSPYRLKMTISESVGHSLFVIKKGELRSFERGQYVTVKAPADPSSGDEYVKLVAGVPGDTVEVIGRDIYVAGIYRGRAKEVSLTGRDLEVIEGGVIPEGYIYIFAPHVDSYDSRYSEIGFVRFNLVTGAAKAIV